MWWEANDFLPRLPNSLVGQSGPASLAAATYAARTEGVDQEGSLLLCG